MTEPTLDEPSLRKPRTKAGAILTALEPHRARIVLDIEHEAAQPSAEVERLRAIADIIDTYEVGYGSTHGISSAEAVAMIADVLAGSDR